ncbi:hypothetical protein I6L27_19665 (plasmid) [Acinetobacter pittii]|uniref:hypothetical protein n=1 Tax=Acinetobacter TaxID=469 RepID=UPI001C2195D2|nr:hypothetical protein [Acinetobacter pittii]QXA10014.1 hypothetical protein I6L27_19665 [Acinetobacter pittii]
MRKKYSVFQENINHINQMLGKGYTYNDIVKDLKENHSLDLTFGTFNSYLHRYRNENPNVKSGESSSIDNKSIESKSDDIQDLKPAEIKPSVNETGSVKTAEKKQHFNTRKDGENFINNLID